MSIVERVESLKKDAYTGENRCTPCTIVNIAIAAVVGMIVATTWPLLAAFLFSSAIVVIYFWGYLVPGTPWITKRYFPDWFLRWFDKQPSLGRNNQDIDLEQPRPAPGRGGGDIDLEGPQAAPGGDGEAVDPEELLTELRVIEECPEEDDVCLVPEFESGWRDRIERLREEDPHYHRIAEVLDVEEAVLEFEHHENGGVTATVKGRPFSRWASHAAFLADVAAAAEIQDRYDDWRSIDIQEWQQLFNALRVFLDRCPDCGGDVTMEPDVRESCCRSIDVMVSSCQECGARLFEAEEPA